MMNYLFRHQYPRKSISRGERMASLVILCLLAGVAAAVYLKGRQGNPWDSEIGAAAHDDAVEPAQSPSLKKGFTAATPPSPAHTSQAGEKDLRFQVAGLKPLGPPEVYPAERLYEKIDGQDAAYLAFGVRQLRFVSLGLADHPARMIDVYEYDMGTPDKALGIFAKERDPQGTPLGFLKKGYRSGPALYFCHGSFYVQLIASDAEPPLGQMAETLAREIAGTPAEKKP
jgi:hypothetical protein